MSGFTSLRMPGLGTCLWKYLQTIRPVATAITLLTPNLPTFLPTDPNHAYSKWPVIVSVVNFWWRFNGVKFDADIITSDRERVDWLVVIGEVVKTKQKKFLWMQSFTYLIEANLNYVGDLFSLLNDYSVILYHHNEVAAFLRKLFRCADVWKKKVVIATYYCLVLSLSLRWMRKTAISLFSYVREMFRRSDTSWQGFFCRQERVNAFACNFRQPSICVLYHSYITTISSSSIFIFGLGFTDS